MDLQILKQETELSRIEILKDSCEKMENFTYLKPFAKEEIAVKKDEIVFKTDQLIKLRIAKKEKMKELSEKIKSIMDDQIILVNEVTSERMETTEDVYLIADQDDEKMGYYSKDGVLVYVRPLLPPERQISIMTKVKDVV